MTTRANTGEQLREVAAALKQDQRTYLHEVMQGQARIAELEALLDECRLSLCPFDCKLLLADQCRYGGEIVPLYSAQPQSDGVMVPVSDVEDYISLLIDEADAHLHGRHQPERQAHMRAEIERVRALLGGDHE